jgi:hypothetical protein
LLYLLSLRSEHFCEQYYVKIYRWWLTFLVLRKAEKMNRHNIVHFSCLMCHHLCIGFIPWNCGLHLTASLYLTRTKEPFLKVLCSQHLGPQVKIHRTIYPEILSFDDVVLLSTMILFGSASLLKFERNYFFYRGSVRDEGCHMSTRLGCLFKKIKKFGMIFLSQYQTLSLN